MIEYQAWATIREAFSENRENAEKLERIVEQLRKKLEKEFSNLLGRYVFDSFNGIWRLSIVGSRNHSSGDWPKIVELFKWISEIAPGSYGIASMIDDEDPSSVSQAFCVYVMKKGSLTKSKDVYLSPFFCEVEEIE